MSSTLPPEFAEMKAEVARRMRVATEDILRSDWKPYAVAAAPEHAGKYDKFLDDLSGASMMVQRVAVSAALELVADEYGATSSIEENEAVARKLVARRKEIELEGVENFRLRDSPATARPLKPVSIVTRVVAGIAIAFFGLLGLAFLIPSADTTLVQRLTGALVLLGIAAALVLVFFILPRMEWRMRSGPRFYQDLMRKEIERRYADIEREV